MFGGQAKKELQQALIKLSAAESENANLRSELSNLGNDLIIVRQEKQQAIDIRRLLSMA